MAEPRETEKSASHLGPARDVQREQRGDDALLDLQRLAGNRAVADMFAGAPSAVEPSPALRVRDSLRAGRQGQPEFGLAVQRLAFTSLDLRRTDGGGDTGTLKGFGTDESTAKL